MLKNVELPQVSNSMPHTIVFANRANTDQDKLLRSVEPLIKHTSQALQMHLATMFEHGARFGIQKYLRQTIEQPLSTIMLAGHLAGIRRAELMLKQAPTPKSLSLSIFSGVLNYFRTREDVDIAQLQKRYKTLSFDIVSKVSDSIKKDLADTTRKLIESGSHVREAKQILGAKFAEYGLKPASKSQIETIFRTHTQIAYSVGKWRAEHHDPLIQNALWGYRYVTAHDDRVRPSHEALDGVTLPKDHPFWQMFYPPNGWNCRCQAIPLFEPAAIVKPPKLLPDGVKIKPDTGFSWNPGRIFTPLSV